MNAVKNWSVLLTIIHTFAALVQINCENDCVFNRFNKTVKTVPCLGTSNRGLVRDVNCTDGSTFHICCKLPYRADVQKRRQKWFRAVTWSGDKISSDCTKRILCEQSCKDGLEGPPRSDYPEVLERDNERDKEYVQAFKQGENQACYQQSSKEHNYDGKSCEADCQQVYPGCDAEMDNNYIIKAYYKSARTFHKLGMWTFSATFMIGDTLSRAKKNRENVDEAIKKGYTRLFDRMVKLDKVYTDWLAKHKGRYGLSDESHEKAWKEFLIIYNKTDPVLIDNINGSLKYSEFSDAVETIKDTLTSFGKSG